MVIHTKLGGKWRLPLSSAKPLLLIALAFMCNGGAMIPSWGSYLTDWWCLLSKCKVLYFALSPSWSHWAPQVGELTRDEEVACWGSLGTRTAPQRAGLTRTPGHPTSCIRFSWDQRPSPTPTQPFCSHVLSHMAGALNLGTPGRGITSPWAPNAKPSLLDWISKLSPLARLSLSSHSSWAPWARAKAIPTPFLTTYTQFLPSHVVVEFVDSTSIHTCGERHF